VQTTLFGHLKGSFTGAVESTPGLLRAADKGTLFLDEIGELPAVGQELLLKVLDHWTVRPVGETRTVPGGRAARLRDQPRPAAAVRDGRFRHDLYQRLKALTIRLTPLRTRPGRRPAPARALPGGGGEGPQEADARA
jgi:transcriptional regulator with PAS, ATPase and Fis domain